MTYPLSSQQISTLIMSKSCWQLAEFHASMRSLTNSLKSSSAFDGNPMIDTHWLIDEYPALPAFESVTDAHDFWTKLKTERDCRLEIDPSDNAINAFWGSYDLVFDAARAMIDMKAISGAEIASKIEVAMEIIDLGGTFDDFELRLLESACADARPVQKELGPGF
jgi:hypothetical protein